MPSFQTVAIETTFHALADPTRRAVIERLARGPATVSELAQPFDMALPSFLQHLRLLEECRLVRTKKTGRVRHCELNATPLAAIDDWLKTQRAAWEDRLDRLDAYLLSLSKEEPNP